MAACSRRFLFLLLLLYFLASTADLLHITIALFKVKVGLIIPLLLFPLIKIWQIPKPLFYAFLLLLLSQTLSAIFGTAPLRSFEYLGIYCLNFLLYFLLPYNLVQTVDLRLFFRSYWRAFCLVGLFATCQLLFSLFGIYVPFSLQKAAGLVRGQAWLYEPSYYALYMTAYTMFHNALAFLRKASPLKLLGQNLLLAVSTSTGLIVSYPALFFSLGALVPTARKKLKFGILIFFLTLAGVTLFFHEIALETVFKFFYFGLSHISFSDRWTQAVSSFSVFLDHPFFGVGLGGIGPYLFAKASAYYAPITTLSELDGFDPTTCFTELLGSLGLFGLFAVFNLLVLFYRSFRSVMADPFLSVETKQTATALFLSLAITVLALQMNQNLFRPYIWIHAAVVYGYFRRVMDVELAIDNTSQ